MNKKIGYIKHALDYIDEYYYDLSYEGICNGLGIGLGHLRNIFKKYVGISLCKYKRRRALIIIIEKIKKNGCLISEGDIRPWDSAKQFSRSFKREFKITPTKYLNGDYDLQQKVDIKSIINKHTLENKLKNYNYHCKDIIIANDLDIYLKNILKNKYNNYFENGFKNYNYYLKDIIVNNLYVFLKDIFKRWDFK